MMSFILSLFRKVFPGKKKASEYKQLQGELTGALYSSWMNRKEIEKNGSPYKLNLEPDITDERDYKYVPQTKFIMRWPEEGKYGEGMRVLQRKLRAMVAPRSGNLVTLGNVGKVTVVNTETEDLRERYDFSPVGNQGSMGSCSAWAFCGVIEALKNSYEDTFDLSELYLYYHGRIASGYPADKDTGANLRDVLKVLKERGVALEQYHPYVASDLSKKPDWSADFCARYFRISRYERVFSVTDFYSAILEGSPIIVGLNCPRSFLTYSGGIYSISENPKVRAKDPIIGGHAVCLVGFEGNVFIGRNSWGTGFGEAGYFRISEASLRLLFMDAWILKVRR